MRGEYDGSPPEVAYCSLQQPTPEDHIITEQCLDIHAGIVYYYEYYYVSIYDGSSPEVAYCSLQQPTPEDHMTEQ